MIDEEIDLLNTYINLENKIKQLERYKQAVSDNYYKAHSLTGGQNMGDNGEVYQKALSPFIVAWEIIESETVLMQRIERLTFRYKHFKLFCDNLDDKQIERLKTFENDEINGVQKMAIDEIKEIEEATAWRYYNGVKIDEDFKPLTVNLDADNTDILSAVALLQGELFQ